MDTTIIKSVARGLRYRPLNHLVGREVEVHGLDHVEDDVRLALGPDMLHGCRLTDPGSRKGEGAVAKYGILHLIFEAASDLLAGDMSTGVPLLRELGFLPGRGVVPQGSGSDDMTCLRMLQEDLDEGRTWLMLFLVGGRPGQQDPSLSIPLRVPEGYFPRSFRVVDGCVSNSNGVWLWKHFYL